jgi:hypothetical protein
LQMFFGSLGPHLAQIAGTPAALGELKRSHLEFEGRDFSCEQFWPVPL